jgi:hypothetical protein
MRITLKRIERSLSLRFRELGKLFRRKRWAMDD